MTHPDPADLQAYKRRALPAKELLAVDDHLAVCEECRRLAASGVTSTIAWQRAAEAVRGEHVSYDAMERHANGELSADERTAMTAHAESCASCAREIADLEAYAQTFAPRPRRWWMATAAAALLIVATTWLWMRDRETPPARPPIVHRTDPVPPATQTVSTEKADSIDSLTPSLRRVAEALESGTLPAMALVSSLQPPDEDQRSPGDPAETDVRILEPAGSVIETDQPTFRWSPGGGGVEARVEVFDRKYALIAESPASTGTSWRIDAPLPRGATYRWQLRVQYPDGRSTTVPAPPDPPVLFHVVGYEALEELREARRSGAVLEAGLICMREGLVEEGARLLALHLAEHAGSKPAQRLAEKAALIAKSPPARTKTSSTGG